MAAVQTARREALQLTRVIIDETVGPGSVAAREMIRQMGDPA